MEELVVKTIVIIVTDLMMIKFFMLPHIKSLNKKYRVLIISNSENINTCGLNDYYPQIYHVPITRKPDPFNDIRVLFDILKLLKKLNVDMVISLTPKAGLLSMLAAFIARTHHRIHIFTGQVWKTMSGLKRELFKFLDKILFFFSTFVLVDSYSQRNFLVEEGIIRKGSSAVLSNGSVCGVDTNRFRKSLESRNSIRIQYGISDKDVIFLYLGRLKKDKGIMDLVTAYIHLNKMYENVYLMIVGPDEENLLSEINTMMGLDVSSRYIYIEYTNNPEVYLSAADIFCLPSYREGFGTVIIEAAAMKLPAIGTNIYGITDAIEDGKSGLLYPVGDVDGLFTCMEKLYGSPELRNKLGTYAYERAKNLFSEEILTSAMMEFVDKQFIQNNSTDMQ